MTSLKVKAKEASQLSDPVAVPVLAGNVLAVHCIVTFGGQLIEGGVLSLILINCTQLLELPQWSVANQVRVMEDAAAQPPATVPSLNVMIGAPSQLSVAVATPVLAGCVIALQLMVTFGGQVMTGGVLSSTKIVCRQLLELPQSSVATQVRFIVLSCGHAPPTVTSLKVKDAVASQLSVAVGVPVLAGNVLAVH